MNNESLENEQEDTSGFVVANLYIFDKNIPILL